MVMNDDIYSSTFARIFRGNNLPEVNRNPYPHAVFEEVFDDEFLRNCLRELKQHLMANFKETDLFKVFQTTDLANLEESIQEAHGKVPNLIRLRECLYSSDFRSFVSKATGAGLLDGAVDCSCNIYTAGCHLLCHDDVIGTRKISYIVYLSEPDDEWLDTDGGQLELYALSPDGVQPTDSPAVTTKPKWNSLVMFEVLPGKSFHSVREVSTTLKTRVSISGWFHVKCVEALNRHTGSTSTLEQLHSVRVRHPTRTLSRTTGKAYTYTARDFRRSKLSEWINPEYLKPESLQRITQVIDTDGSVQLFDFLLSHIASETRSKLTREDCRNRRDRDSYNYAVGHGWSVQGPPHIRRYLSYKPEGRNQQSSSGELLKTIAENVLESTDFQSWLDAITGYSCRLLHSEIRRFRPGLDYTLAHGGKRQHKPEVDVALCLTSGKSPGVWGSGDVGGFSCFVPIVTEDGPPDVYEIGEQNNITSLAPSYNCMSLMKVDSGISDFVKYVSVFANSSRWDVVARFST